MGCTVAPGDKQLDCPCHQSVYDLTGKNISGPAPSPLAPFPVKVVDGAVVRPDAAADQPSRRSTKALRNRPRGSRRRTTAAKSASRG